MKLEWATLRTVAGMADDIGIISAYVSLDPHWRADPTAKSPWELRLRHELDEMREDARQRLSRDEYRALTERLDGLTLELERLRDPSAQGQGRALFAGVASGEVRTVTLQMPLVDRVVFARGPHLRPLVAAWSTSGPAGAAAVSADEVRAVDMRFGWVEEVAATRYANHVEQRELKGPAGDNPALAQHSASQHDLYERREDEKLLRFLRSVGGHLAQLADDLAWDHLVITGESNLVHAVTDGLPPQWNDHVVTLSHPVTQLTPPKLVATVEPALAEARQQRRQHLATRAHGAAMAAGTGAAGLGETLEALQEGRVAHLLLVTDGNWSGSRTPDGRLTPTGEVPPGASEDDLQPEPELGERMIELALSHSSQVTMLEPADAAPLADFGGIGALLRW